MERFQRSSKVDTMEGAVDATAERTTAKTMGRKAETPNSTDRSDTPTASTGADLYRTKEVVQILDISRRQLQYWAQTDLVVPSVKTRGGHHRYTFEDLVALKATKRLIDAGVSVQRIRASIQALRTVLPNVQRPLSELVLVATGEVVLVFLEDTAFEAVTGQEWIFEVAAFKREVDAWKKLGERSSAQRARPARRAGAWTQTA
jgi:DNA-binding transcriptional MerR regulator